MHIISRLRYYAKTRLFKKQMMYAYMVPAKLVVRCHQHILICVLVLISDIIIDIPKCGTEYCLSSNLIIAYSSR